MTPLFLQIMRALHEKDGEESDLRRVMMSLREPHCFELSEVSQLADAIWNMPASVHLDTLFLPAPETWLETRVDGRRVALLLREQGSGAFDIARISTGGIEPLLFLVVGQGKWQAAPQMSDHDITAALGLVTTYLAIINTPRLVARRARAPHRQLERLVHDRGSEITLRPWTEIHLELTPKLATGEGPASLTGKKCLHFCRSHLRVQNGRLVVVRSHWRGDAALGVKQADYRVTA